MSEPPQRRDNGLRADQFIALADVDPRLGEHLLDLLRLAEIPAYLEPTTDPRAAVRYRVSGPVERLYVQADQRQEARAVVVAAAHEAGEETITETTFPSADAPAAESAAGGPDAGRPQASSATTGGADLLAGIDTDAEFARIVSGFTAVGAEPAAVSTPDAADQPEVDQDHENPAVVADPGPVPDAAITDADLDEAAELHARQRREAQDAAEQAGEDLADEEDHFHPPPAPPFPVPTANTVGAVLLLVLGLVVLIRGDVFGLGSEASFPVGVVLLLVASGLIIRGLRDQPDPGEEPEDDGAAV